MFGDIPLVTTNDWRMLTLLPRTPKADVYKAIIADLKEAQELLPADYSIVPEQRTRANRFAATALLARVYLYQQEWANAEAESNTLINATSFFTLPTLQETYNTNSPEAILQFQVDNVNWPFVAREGHEIIPQYEGASPNYYLTDQLLAAFEEGDQRKGSMD